LENEIKIDETLDQEKKGEMIDKSLDLLEPKYREPIILYYFENLTYQEIADILKIPISTVGVRIKRAKEKIKNLIKMYE
jgi:RNA polymerase sigma-70 factor (ECF subfamily)